MRAKTWTLLGPDGARGGYITDRVFFRNERDARAAGYRPCAVCLPRKYAAHKATKATGP